jgi:hypothetical protein
VRVAPAGIAVVASAMVCGQVIAAERVAPKACAAVLIAGQGVEDAVFSASWIGSVAEHNEGAVLAGLAERAVAAELQSAGFDMIDLAPHVGRLRAAGIGADDPNPDQLRTVASLTGCDVVIHGVVTAEAEHGTSGMLEESSGLIVKTHGAVCTATVTLRAHQVARGQGVADAESVMRNQAGSGTACAREAAARAGHAAAVALRQRLAVAGGSGAKVLVQITGVETLGDLKAVMAMLEKAGARGLHQRSFREGHAELELTAPSSARALADAVDEKTLKGKRLQVTGLATDRLELRFVR